MLSLHEPIGRACCFGAFLSRVPEFWGSCTGVGVQAVSSGMCPGHFLSPTLGHRKGCGMGSWEGLSCPSPIVLWVISLGTE